MFHTVVDFGKHASHVTSYCKTTTNRSFCSHQYWAAFAPITLYDYSVHVVLVVMVVVSCLFNLSILFCFSQNSFPSLGEEKGNIRSTREEKERMKVVELTCRYALKAESLCFAVVVVAVVDCKRELVIHARLRREEKLEEKKVTFQLCIILLHFFAVPLLFHSFYSSSFSCILASFLPNFSFLGCCILLSILSHFFSTIGLCFACTVLF